MKIGQLSEQTGVECATIRYYEREGLMPAPARTRSGYRNYGRQAVDLLQFIQHCRLLDMPLADVRRLLELSGDPAAPCGEVNGVIDAQLERVRTKRLELEALECQLVNLRAKCRARKRVAECRIVDELMHAAHARRCACHAASTRTRPPPLS